MAHPASEEWSLQTVLDYFDAVKDQYLGLKPFEVRVRTEGENRAKIDFIDFPGGAVSQVIDTNQSVTLKAPDGSDINVFVGGRDDAFFNDLPGSSARSTTRRSSTRCRRRRQDLRELPIPKTLLELEGNTLFNFDPANPQHGRGVKLDLPPGRYTWSGDRFVKDADGNYRFVYSGEGRPGRASTSTRSSSRCRSPSSRSARRGPHRQRLGRELGAEGVGQDRDDPGRPARCCAVRF